MKNLLLTFFCFASIPLTAQVTPEFIYTNGYVSPLSLDGIIPKYSFVDGPTSEVKIFSSNHSLWKTIGIPGVEMTNGGWQQVHVSTTLFNSDTLLEAVYRRVGDTAKLITETGAVLFTADSARAVGVDLLQNAPPAISVNEPIDAAGNHFYSIYRGPAFTRIGPRIGRHVYRAYLSDGSEVTIASSAAGGWVSAQPIIGSGSTYLDGGMSAIGGQFLFDNIVNSDAKYEAIFNYPSTPSAKLIANDGSVLLATIGSSGRIVHSRLAGQPDRIIVQDNTENKVYAVPGLQLEHTYTFGSGLYGANGLNRVSLETSGVKYYHLNPTTNTLDMYNADHTFWKSVPLVMTSGAVQPPRILDISEKTVNSDNHVEVIYEQSLGNRSHGRVTNDLQGSLFIYDVKQSGSTKLHRFPDGTAKLIVYQDTSSQTYTRIYGFPMTIPVGIEEAAGGAANVPFTHAPNPASDVLHLTFPSAALRRVTMHNIQGLLVLAHESRDASFTCNVAALPRGLYMVTIGDGERRHFGKVVLQ